MQNLFFLWNEAISLAWIWNNINIYNPMNSERLKIIVLARKVDLRYMKMSTMRIWT